MKLELISKVLLATSAINYIALSMSELSKGIDPASTRGENYVDEELLILVRSLTNTYEHLANFMNNHDAICPIDERVLNPISEILIFGKDETEE